MPPNASFSGVRIGTLNKWPGLVKPRISPKPLMSAEVLLAGIRNGRFEYTSPSLVLDITQADWLTLVEQEMNTRLDAERRLFMGIYNHSPRHADLILTFHHVIMDAASGMNLLDELLRLCALGEAPPHSPLKVAPPVEQNFPRRYKGVQGVLRIARYAFAQMSDEMRYQINVRGRRTPPVKFWLIVTQNIT